MPTTTARRGLHIPVAGDLPDGPAAFLSLANDLDWDFVLIEGTDAARPAAALSGRVYRPTDVANTLYFDTGASWITIRTGGPFLPTAGGTMTGATAYGFQELQDAKFRNYREKISTVASITASAQTLDPATSPIWDVTTDTNCTFTFNGSDGDSLMLVLRMGGTLRTITWPAAVKWPSGAAPSFVINTVNVFAWTRINALWLPGGMDVH